MQRRTNIQASTSIIILSIFTILVQFASYYFFEAYFAIWGISCLISVICCHIILEQTSTYIACVNYSLLTIFISLVINALAYFGNVTTFLPYSGAMLGIVIINWLIPMLHCSLRNMLDYGTNIDHFTEFYRNSSLLFLLFYTTVIIYGNFGTNAFPWAYKSSMPTANFIPFNVIASQIEDYLYGLIPLSDIVTYLMSRILIYIPYGFYITLALRRQNRLPRLLALLFMPFLIEVMQFFIIPGRYDIDDLIYAFLGGLIGCAAYFLINVIFRAFSGRDFLAGETNYRYLGSPVHF